MARPRPVHQSQPRIKTGATDSLLSYRSVRQPSTFCRKYDASRTGGILPEIPCKRGMVGAVRWNTDFALLGEFITAYVVLWRWQNGVNTGKSYLRITNALHFVDTDQPRVRIPPPIIRVQPQKRCYCPALYHRACGSAIPNSPYLRRIYSLFQIM